LLQLGLLTGTIRRMTLETVMALSVNLKIIFLTLLLYCLCHVSPQRLRITFYVTYGVL